MPKRDFREFVFTATGADTPLGDLDAMMLFDNMIAEVERLGTLADLLTAAKPEEFDARLLPGVGLLLSDVRARMRAILDLTVANLKKRR